MINDTKEHLKKVKYVICDFVCPTNNTRDLLKPDYIIFMNTINRSIYEDTNKVFEIPKFDFEVKHKNAEMYSFLINNPYERNITAPFGMTVKYDD